MLPEIEHKPSGERPQSSGLADLVAVYTAIDDEQTQTRAFDIVGSRAAVRYRRMRNAERLALARRVQANEPDSGQFEVNAQFLIEACDEILVRGAGGELEPLIPGQKVTFDLRPGESVALHQAMGVEERDIRRSVLRLFQGVDDALLAHAELVSEWMATVQDLTMETFAGG